MAAVVQTRHVDIFTRKENVCVLVNDQNKFVLKGSIDVKSVLIQVTEYRQTGKKQLSESVFI